eukprot:TRINITY_DN17376_c0_g2_i1.p1 TRINITY_DN17376_c0_g2~~TRINITY_DN17376_c0_g2_i1.p1  ORF type:complete len:710 (+),score=114.43 TRINITY_DN17376_c0_g2_i1:138-2267(+)
MTSLGFQPPLRRGSTEPLSPTSSSFVVSNGAGQPTIGRSTTSSLEFGVAKTLSMNSQEAATPVGRTTPSTFLVSPSASRVRAMTLQTPTGSSGIRRLSPTAASSVVRTLSPTSSSSMQRVSFTGTPLGVRARVASSFSTTTGASPATTSISSVRRSPAPQPMLIKSTSSGITFVPTTVSPAGASASMASRPRPMELHSGSASPAPSTGRQVSDGIPEEDSNSDEDSPQPRVGRVNSAWANYPATPAFRMTCKALGMPPRFGIDIGGVLTRESDPTVPREVLDSWDHTWEAPGAFDAVRRIVAVFGPQNVFLVSKMRPGGSMQRRVEHWLHETCDFCKVTGVPKQNIVFVAKVDGPDGKGPAASQLGLSFFVDDKIEALSSVFSDEYGNSGDSIEKYGGLLFHFSKGGWNGMAPHCDMSEISPMMRRCYRGVGNWEQVIDVLKTKLPGGLRQKVEELTKPMEPWKPPAAAESKETSTLRARRENAPWLRSNISTQQQDNEPTWRSPVEKPREVAPPTMVAQVSTVTQTSSGGSQSALQWTANGRPKLVLKPKSMAPASTTTTTSVTTLTSSAVRATSPTAATTIRATSPTALRATSPTAMQSRSAVIVSSPKATMVAPTMFPGMSSGAAVRASSPPAKIVASTTTTATGATAAAPARIQVDSTGRPKLMIKPRSAPQAVQQAAAPAGPAMQKDPATGRPRLVLKPRSVGA